METRSAASRRWAGALPRRWAGPLRRPGWRRAIMATAGVLVLSLIASEVLTTRGDERTHAIPLTERQAADLADAARSCSVLTPARLAGQVMAMTGFEPATGGGIGGLSSAEWEIWKPWETAVPADDAASLLALAHLTCDLVGRLRGAGTTGDPWPTAVAALWSSPADLRAAADPPAVEFANRVVAYTNWYVQHLSQVSAAPARSAPAPLAAATPTTSAPSPTPTPSPTATATTPPAPPRPALTLAFPSFRDATGLRLTNSAQVVDGRIDLAFGWQSTGSAWAVQTIETARSFQTMFRGVIPVHVDGMAFVVQSESEAADGGLGAGNGYGSQPDGDQSRMIRPSVAVEVDTWDNTFDPPNVDTHLAVTTDGDITRHHAWADPGFSMSDNKPFTVWVTYDAPTHTLTVYASATTSRPANPLFSYVIDLTAHLGARAWVGFTGGTGQTTLTDARESLLSWSLTSN